MDSTPSRRFRQNSEILRAPGKRPAMPTIAILEGFITLPFSAAGPTTALRTV